MHSLKALLLPLLAVPLLSASVPDAGNNIERGSLRVKVMDLSSTEGIIGAALYTSKQGFPDKPERAYLSKAMKLQGASPVFEFRNIPYGTYAVSILHDENGNGKMDKTFIGIPKEGFGVSNNPPIGYGPPSFKEARFEITGKEVEVRVAMNYLEKMTGSKNSSNAHNGSIQQKDHR
ncbi:MAG: hypothetical protein A3K90_05320 [Pelodictyon luteolum]|uniref:DUF2141 domain-containing protein n=1 Tax=Pelodictyon luteolum TaxID=1100 RepID=A0A165ME77_PELLU|nr:DUF2141 domain-containing protein [Pelodictyon luteolum]KZK75142.1 MAG: hypothetical protein A3K90_05320 [Pelodictyon luteolum]